MLLAEFNYFVDFKKFLMLGIVSFQDYDRRTLFRYHIWFCSYFERQFEIAEITKLPMFFHMRSAAPDFLEIVKRNQHRLAVHSLMSYDGSFSC